MSEEQKRILEQQLWNIANTLRGKMGADEFRDYIFIDGKIVPTLGEVRGKIYLLDITHSCIRT